MTRPMLRPARNSGLVISSTAKLISTSAAPHAGFTSGTPWIEVNPNYSSINVAAELDDPNSILAHYRRLIALRKQLPIIIEGRYVSWLDDHPEVFAYTRTLGTQSLLVLANFTAREVIVDIPTSLRGEWQPLLDAKPNTLRDRATLGPFETITGLAERTL